MTESGPPESGTPLPPVNADDLKRVWGLIRNMVVDHGVSGIDERMISRQCEAGADGNAVFFRAALLLYLFQSGVLDDWWASRDLIPQVSWSACDPLNHSPLRTLVRGSRISVLARQWPHSFSNADWFDFSLQNGIVDIKRRFRRSGFQAGA